MVDVAEDGRRFGGLARRYGLQRRGAYVVGVVGEHVAAPVGAGAYVVAVVVAAVPRVPQLHEVRSGVVSVDLASSIHHSARDLLVVGSSCGDGVVLGLALHQPPDPAKSASSLTSIIIHVICS